MIRNYSKSDPGCSHRLREYLSEKTGISLTKDMVIKNVYKVSKHTGKKKLQYRATDITVVDKSGNIFPFMKDQKRYDLHGVDVDYFIVNVPRAIEEFGIKVNNVGNYRDSLSGGWYSNCELVEVDGRYFAYMECACRG